MTRDTRRQTYQLKIPDQEGGTLHNYVFTDEDHARKWMAQKCIAGTGYKAVPVVAWETVRVCDHCGQSVTHECVRADKSRQAIEAAP